MAYDAKTGAAPLNPYDNGGFVREAAILADRAKKIETTSVSFTDPWSGQGASFPVVTIGGVQIDVAAEADKWRVAPRFREGSAYVETLESFIALVNRHKDESSAIFANLKAERPWLRAVIDYHTLERTPRDGAHLIHYDFPLSPEFLAWRAISGRKLDQTQFAEWIEDHIHELASPTVDEDREFFDTLGLKFGLPHELVKVARGISIHAAVKVSNIQTLATGEAQMAFEETHDVKDSDRKPIKVPGLVLVSVPLFYGGDLVRLPFRLRYERVGGAVVWKFLAFRLDRILLGALEGEYERAIEGTGLPGFRGTPEMS